MIPKLNLSGKTVAIGIGSGQGDDFVGRYVVQNLKPTQILTPIDCGTTPENHLAKIEAAAPDNILIIDAADFGGEPGEARIIDPKSIQLSISTHNPTGMLITFLNSVAPVTVLGISPASQAEFSGPVKATAEEIIAFLNGGAERS